MVYAIDSYYNRGIETIALSQIKYDRKANTGAVLTQMYGSLTNQTIIKKAYFIADLTLKLFFTLFEPSGDCNAF